MFYLSDRLQHKTTGDVGLVVGYGNQKVGNKYVTTIKVHLTGSASIGKIKEDFCCKWSLFSQLESSY